MYTAGLCLVIKKKLPRFPESIKAPHVMLCGYSILCIVLLRERKDDWRQHFDTSADPGRLCALHHKDSALPLKGCYILREAI